MCGTQVYNFVLCSCTVYVKRFVPLKQLDNFLFRQDTVNFRLQEEDGIVPRLFTNKT